jgi:hypothetical protein
VEVAPSRAGAADRRAPELAGADRRRDPGRVLAGALEQVAEVLVGLGEIGPHQRGGVERRCAGRAGQAPAGALVGGVLAPERVVEPASGGDLPEPLDREQVELELQSAAIAHLLQRADPARRLVVAHERAAVFEQVDPVDLPVQREAV